MSDWPALRAQIVDAFDGELPGPTLEAAIVDLHDANPACVTDSYPSVATSLKAGKINSGWAVLKAAAIDRNNRKENPTVSREKRIRVADQWLRNAGVHYDRWTEVEDALFGDQGTIRDLATDKLRSRYHDAWTSVRPAGEAAEHAELERADTWKRNRQQLLNAARKETDEAVAAAA